MPDQTEGHDGGTDHMRFFAEDLSWDFQHDPAMECPNCEYNAVEVQVLLEHGFAECHQCGREYSAEVVAE